MSSAPHRARMVGTRHMVAAGHHLAAQAAFQILEAGGNAVDAGVAGGLALSVVQSEYVGFGGVAPIMIRLAESGEVVTVSGLGVWPRAASAEHFRRHHDGAIPPGLLRTVTPAAPDAWITALEKWGTLSFGDVASAAVCFARDGFPAPSLMTAIVEKAREGYLRWPSNAEIYLPGGRPPQPGEIFVQSDLARTIQHIIDEEAAASARSGRMAGLAAARRAFYRGDIAQAMVRYHRDNGGWLTAEDLAEFRVAVEPPLAARLGDIEVFTCGPWCQGPVLAQTLRILDGIGLEAMDRNSAQYVHTLVEALKLAFADRHHHVGDPRFVDVPIEDMLSDAYTATRRAMIDPLKAFPGMPAAGRFQNTARWPAADPQPTQAADEISQIDTSYICVVDSRGNLFSATPSDGSATGPVIPGLGFVPSTRGMQSWTDPSVPAVLAPGKRPRLTPNPAIAVRAGRWFMPFGSPGNDVQPQAMLQVLLNIFLFGMTPRDAVEQPRFATFSYPRSSCPHSYSPGLLNVEGRFSKDAVASLRTLGHDVAEWPDWEYAAGAVCLILHDRETGTMEGASDPRRPTGVVGW